MDTDSKVLHLITPGETVTSDAAFMKGHGTYNDGDDLVGTVVGVVERINKLISVKPFRARYNGEIGDVVVGRISEVTQKRWKVDIGARQDAMLLLAAVNLPGGELRRRSESDELQMRQLLAEGDMISAEIQAFFGDGAVSLHTRSLKYGKLKSGQLITVPSSLVKRSKAHFIHYTLAEGLKVDVILGMNGFVWIAKGTGGLEKKDTPQQQQQDADALYANVNEPVTIEERQAIARISNCILALAREGEFITEAAILHVYEASKDVECKDILANSSQIVDIAKMNA
ncbi:UNVERIFIED_CONTAM: Exosome complex component RRP4 [Siphonaria sp. JEL0065]|nr:Exosome complex component RRP4 [Siphonaria sp. JEL0065]